MNKFAIKDIEKCLAFFKKYQAVDVTIKFDDRERLIMTIIEGGGQSITTTCYNAESSKFPEVTKTETL